MHSGLPLLLALSLAGPASGQTVRVVDGDSLSIDGRPVRLWGIDAPENAQDCTEVCAKGGRPWPCGQVATVLLTMLIDGRTPACERKDTDRFGRTVALCRVNGVDLSAAMVEAGMALAFRRYSLDYVAHEDRARIAKRGMWAGSFTPPWDWRRERSGK